MTTDRSGRPPVQGGSDRTPTPTSSRQEIDAFLEQVRALGPAAPTAARGRMIFALDATMSRQPTWDSACRLQAEMFREAAAVGGLDVQLLYYRGFNECAASGWVSNPDQLAKLMGRITCRGGHTQIGKVLAHARREHATCPVQVMVFVGDAMEEELDELCAVAGELGLRGVVAFMFQEGRDAVAEQAFREVARLSRGAYCRFDPGAAQQLGDLLRAAAAYAAGGVRALQQLSARGDAGSRKLLQQLG